MIGKNQCEHGSLKRSCRICELEAALADCPKQEDLDAAVFQINMVKAELGETNEALAACQAEGGGWKAKADEMRGALEKILKNVVHTYWEDRGVDQMQHADNCVCKSLQAALAEFDK